ncbi:hypothetical protein SAMN06295909_1852 [Plantibacter sp. VKM Ac-1784]|uniref:Uncharacterized protein n=1 Tax=Plantibacter elymi (nom. nud.) TaxID=199708 RepID=A0ABY1RCB5_9MICO|nr:hypothetical protein SAMN06295909_1852 [Plantibacter sp. VKM Ac-1784]
MKLLCTLGIHRWGYSGSSEVDDRRRYSTPPAFR